MIAIIYYFKQMLSSEVFIKHYNFTEYNLIYYNCNCLNTSIINCEYFFTCFFIVSK